MAETPLVFEIATFAVLAVFFVVDLFIIGRKPHALHQGMRAAYRVLRGHGVDLRRTHVVLRRLEACHRVLLRLADRIFAEHRQPVRVCHYHVEFRGARRNSKFVLSIGITVALVLRGMFILVGAAIISRFTWVFFLFGAFLIVTAIKLVAGGDEDEEYHENALIRALHQSSRSPIDTTAKSCVLSRTV